MLSSWVGRFVFLSRSTSQKTGWISDMYSSDVEHRSRITSVGFDTWDLLALAWDAVALASENCDISSVVYWYPLLLFIRSLIINTLLTRTAVHCTWVRSYHLLATMSFVNGSAHLTAPTTTHHAQTLSRANERSQSVACHTGTVCTAIDPRSFTKNLQTFYVKGELNLDNKWKSDDLFYIIMNEIHPCFNQFCVILKLS